MWKGVALPLALCSLACQSSLPTSLDFASQCADRGVLKATPTDPPTTLVDGILWVRMHVAGSHRYAYVPETCETFWKEEGYTE
jgi:hypothetical protein